ncbi:FkbM family methyltransferase [Halopseudomonas sp.]|uniref:FkbM family methyltransferase n=1 Tax=Halopseudomonas sp. TaxID=2901191 RepID=UPI003562212B
MPIPRLEHHTIEIRRQRVSARGLNQWPQEEPDDDEQIERFRLWLDGLHGEAVLTHPFYPLILPVQSGFSARMAYYFAIGDYEQADLQLIDEMLLPGDRVMECGAGAGVTGSFAAMRSGQPVVVVEPNKRMYPQIRNSFAANGQQLQLVEAAVVPDAYHGEQIELGIYDEYWWSSALTPAAADQQASVPARALSSLLADYEPSVLILDIEGGECGLFPAQLPAALRMIMIEIHTPDIGELPTVELVNRIQAQGFRLCRLLAQTWVFLRS